MNALCQVIPCKISRVGRSETQMRNFAKCLEQVR